MKLYCIRFLRPFSLSLSICLSRSVSVAVALYLDTENAASAAPATATAAAAAATATTVAATPVRNGFCLGLCFLCQFHAALLHPSPPATFPSLNLFLSPLLTLLSPLPFPVLFALVQHNRKSQFVFLEQHENL